MSVVTPLHGGSMLPARPLRAALLAFVSALALVEAGSGLIVGQAWRLHEGDALSPTERVDLAQMLDRLRVMEDVVVAGALATTLLWSLLAIYNATFGARGSLRVAAIAAAGCAVAPILFLAFRAAEAERGTGRLIMVGAQALALYLPFWALGRVAEGVGGRRMPFMRWYLALAASFVVHDLFTSTLDLANPQQSDDLGRTAMMFLVNALVVGVMAVMAADATRAMDRTTTERAFTHRLLHDDANRRERPGAISFEPGPSSQATIPSLPPPPAMPTSSLSMPASVAPMVAASSVATLTPPHPQPAVGATMPPPIVQVAFPAPPPVLAMASTAHTPAPPPAPPVDSPLDVVPIVITPAVEPAIVVVTPSVELPVVAVPPVAMPALQPLSTIGAPATADSAPTDATADAVDYVTPDHADGHPAAGEARIEPVSAAMPSMFQPLTRPRV